MCLAVPMKIQKIDSDGGTAEYGNVQQRINISLVENPAVGDYVIVHAGFAIEKLDTAEAEQRIKLFKEIEMSAGL